MQGTQHDSDTTIVHPGQRDIQRTTYFSESFRSSFLPYVVTGVRNADLILPTTYSHYLAEGSTFYVPLVSSGRETYYLFDQKWLACPSAEIGVTMTHGLKMDSRPIAPVGITPLSYLFENKGATIKSTTHFRHGSHMLTIEAAEVAIRLQINSQIQKPTVPTLTSDPSETKESMFIRLAWLPHLQKSQVVDLVSMAIVNSYVHVNRGVKSPDLLSNVPDFLDSVHQNMRKVTEADHIVWALGSLMPTQVSNISLRITDNNTDGSRVFTFDNKEESSEHGALSFLSITLSHN